MAKQAQEGGEQVQKGNVSVDNKDSFVGYAEDGRGMYKSNFPKGTPKTAKSKVILDYIQNVWSKNPITLKINENGQTRDVVAQFDPTYSEDTRFKSDASKLMGGNRHGTASDQRVTLDLADDYYQIASEAEYNYSKDETGKDTPTHEGVRKWHYFVNDIYFSEFDSDDYRPYRVTINVKEKSDGNFVYSFSAESQEGSSTPQTLHAVVSDDKVTANAQPSDPIIHQTEPVVNSEDEKNTVKKRDLAEKSEKDGERAEQRAQESGDGGSSSSTAEREGDTVADERAERLKQWKEITSFSAKELNEARKYVKDFDNLSFKDRLRVLQTIRSAEGVDAKTVRGVANLMLYAEGLNFRFAEGIGNKGLYVKQGDDVTILINKDAEFKTTMRATIAHELTHYLEGKAGYKALASYILITAKKSDMDATRKEYEDHYKESGEKYDESLILSEIVAREIGARLTSERFLQRYAQKDAKLIKRVGRFLKGLGEYIKTKDKDAYAEVSRVMAFVNNALLSADEGGVEGRKYSYAGTKAKTADKLKLATAQEMLAKGADSEAVRKETGWFKGYDGKWRFEIDDSGMKVSVPTTNYPKVGDIVDHPALFEAYPDLKDIYVTIHDIKGYSGSYSRVFGDIELSRDLLNNPDGLRSVLIHELQHAIQDYEGFARGASIEYWEKKLVEGYDSRQAYVKAEEKALLERIKDMRINDRDFLDDMELLMTFEPDHPRGKIDWETLEQIEEDSPAWKNFDRRRDALEEKYGESKVFNYLDAVGRLEQIKHRGERFASDLYFETAGEIEARDVQKRLHLDTTQRKNTRPDIDQEDVVFADGGVSYYAANDKNAENESTKEQLRNHLDEVNEMDPVANVKYHVINKERAKQDAKDFYKSKGYKVDRQNFGIIEMGEGEVELSSNYANTAAEFAAWMTIPNVLKRGRLISGHNDHKGEGFPTYTFAAPVVINGKKGVVAVVVRKTGKYRYKMHRILMPDGSVFVYNDINENAEPTGSDILLNKKEKGPDIDSASTNSISQKTDLSTTSAKKTVIKRDLAPRKGKAPTFYSYMAYIIDGIKENKISASGLVNYLKGKGVKNEELKWSGIETWLEGKKSVTKAELQEFVAGNQLQIEEKAMPETKWNQYKLDEGKNYREIIFTLPDSKYVNTMMQTHWGTSGVLAHARVQDVKTEDGREMLFIEEIQSDWHNEGNKLGYEGDPGESPVTSARNKFNENKKRIRKLRQQIEDYEENYPEARTLVKLREEYNSLKSEQERLESKFGSHVVFDTGDARVPDAPFRDTYQEFVLKSLIRKAAEEGYDTIGWTPSDMQAARWSDDFAEGYRIEYDQEIPSFLKKYGKKWGAKVSASVIEGGHEVWSMDITDSMRDAVLDEGQVLYDLAPRKVDVTPTAKDIAEWEKPITLQDVETLRSIGRKSINSFTSEDIEKARKWAYKFYKDLGVKSPFFRAWFGEWRAHDDKTKVVVVEIPKVATEKQRDLEGVIIKDTQSNGQAWKVVISGHGERNTRGHSGEKKKSVAGLTNIRGLVENAILFNTEVHEHHDNNAINDYIVFDHKLYSLGVDVDGNVALYRITVEEYYQDGKHPDSKRFHNLKYIEEVAKIQTKKVAENREGRQDFDESRAVSFDEILATTYSISDLYGFVKAFDKEFSTAPEVSKYVLNEDGTPKVFYHGTRKENGEFWEFDYNKAKKKGGLGFKALGHGNYFTTSKLDGTEMYGSRVIPAYLSFKKPMIVESSAGFDFRAKVSETLDIDARYMTYPSIQTAMKNRGFDGVVQVDKNGNVTIAVAFDSTQIKSATDNIGTFDRSKADIRYDLAPRKGKADSESNNKVKAFSEIAVTTALYDSLDHGDTRQDNLILMSKMPRYITEKFGISGNLYLYRDHAYENMVSREQAEQDGRPIKRGKKDIHFHNLGIERMTEAILSLDNPIISVEVHSKDNNPTVIMVLPVLDDNGSPLRAVLSFYSNQAINGSFEQKPHIVLTITPCQMSESSGARKGWAEFISEGVEGGRVLDYDKKRGSVLSVIAQQARLGNITEASLNDSISRFKHFVNDFKQKNKINYDLARRKGEAEKTVLTRSKVYRTRCFT